MPANGGDGGDVVLVADAVGEQLVSDLPGEDARVLHLQLLDEVDHLGRGHPRLAPPDGAGQDGTRLVVPGDSEWTSQSRLESWGIKQGFSWKDIERLESILFISKMTRDS